MFFLEYRGLASLFHDIGYPFEIPFEQVMTCFEVDKKKRGKGTIYLAYHDVDALTALGDEAKTRSREIYGRDFESTDELLAYDITAKLGEAYDFDYDYMLGQLKSKPGAPNENGYLNEIGCFNTDKPVDFDMLTKFTQEELDTIAPMEHERWIREHISMGWTAGDEYERVGLKEEKAEKEGGGHALPTTDEDASEPGGEPVALTSAEEAAIASGKTTLKELRAGYRETLRIHKLCMDGDATKEQWRMQYDIENYRFQLMLSIPAIRTFLNY